MEQEYSDFLRKIQKVSSPRRNEIRNSWGVRDAFRFYRKTKPEGHSYVLRDVDFYKIIRSVNLRLCDCLRNADTVPLPFRMGCIETLLYSTRVEYDGKTLVNTHPVDWNSTLKLWYEDPEAMRDKTLVRLLDKDMVKLRYNRSTAEYVNKSFFTMEFNRELKKSIRRLKNEGKLQTYYNGVKKKWHSST